MSSFPDTSIPPAGLPGTQAAHDIIAGLQNEIAPERIAGRIREMLEATSVGPDGVECPDWRTIEAGLKFYLSFMCPAAADGGPAPAAPAGSRASNGVAPILALPGTAPGGAVSEAPAALQARQQAVAKRVRRRQLEGLDFMRRMMVLDSDALTSRRDAEGKPVPRLPLPAATGAAKRDPLLRNDRKPSVFDLVIFRKARWLAVLAGCTAVVWGAGNSLREPASAEPASAPRQVSPSRPAASPAVATQPPQNAEYKNWFLEDQQAQKNPQIFE